MNLVIRPAAREDILRQYRYYLVEQEAEDAAEKFLDAVHATVEYVFRRPGVRSTEGFEERCVGGIAIVAGEGLRCGPGLLPCLRG